MPTSIRSQGTKLAYSDGGSPSVFANVVNVVNISGLGGGSVGMNDTSNLDSTSREKSPGLPDEGSLNVTFNPDPDAVSHVALRAARTAQTRLEFRVTFTDTTPSVATFYGYVMTFEVNVATGNPVRGAMTIEIDGPVYWT